MSPAAASPDLAQILAAACTEAVRPSRCEIAEAGALQPDVVVTWTGPFSADVEVHAATSLRRSLSFRAEDAAGDVWRSIGLVAGALVTRATLEKPPQALPPAPVPARGPVSFWIDAGALLGRGIEHGPPGLGGTLRGGYRLPWLPVFVGASASYASAGRGPSDLGGRWTTFSLGAGAVFSASTVVLRPRLDVLLTRLVAEAPEGPMGGTSGSRRLAGAGAGLEAVWPSAERVAVVLGADGSFLSGATAIRRGGTSISAFPALSYRFVLGIEVAVLP